MVQLPPVAILVGSTVFTLWARWTLGKMWSSVPAVREKHELRTEGPYRVTRHPAYGAPSMIRMSRSAPWSSAFKAAW